MSKTTVGRKDDQGKLRWGLLRRSLALPLEAVIRVLMFGASKYGDENWQLVANPKVRYRDALDRHLAEIDKGIMVDPDTGEHHMAHVATNALFLLWFYLTGAKETTKPPVRRDLIDLAPGVPLPPGNWTPWPEPGKLRPQSRHYAGPRGYPETPARILLRCGVVAGPGVGWDWGTLDTSGYEIVAYELVPKAEYDPHGEAGR